MYRKWRHKSHSCRQRSKEIWIWVPKEVLFFLKYPRPLGYLKKINFPIFKNISTKNIKRDVGNRKEFSRHVTRKKYNFYAITKFKGGFFKFSYNSKGKFIRVLFVKFSPSCKLIEAYLMDELKHNLLSINQLCDVGFGVSFNAKNYSIKHVKRKITL